MTLPRLLIIAAAAASASALPLVAEAGKPSKRNVQHSSGPSVEIHASYEEYSLYSVDREPTFPGGERALLRYINSERRYPDEAFQAGISGRVLCSFTIETDGRVTDVKVIRGVESSLDREAVRIITNMPRWEPAVIADQAVPVSYFLPIPFRL